MWLEDVRMSQWRPVQQHAGRVQVHSSLEAGWSRDLIPLMTAILACYYKYRIGDARRHVS